MRLHTSVLLYCNSPVISTCVELRDQGLELRVTEVDAQFNKHIAEFFPGNAARVVRVHGLELSAELVPQKVDLVDRHA